MNENKVNHPEIKIFYEYLDGELDSKKSTSFEEHLNSCQQCKKIFANLENFYKKVESLTDVEVSPNFTNNVIKALSRSTISNINFRQSIIFQVFCSLIIFISLIVFQIPIKNLNLNIPIDWLSSIELNWFNNLQIPEISLPVFNALKALNFSIQIPSLPKFSAIQPSLIFTLVICSGFLWLIANSFLLTQKDQPNTHNGG